jgi:RHS repeat-associated protein
LHYLTSIFLTLIFLVRGSFAAATSQASSAPLGDLCNLAVDQEFLTTDCTEYTDKSGLDRQGTTNAKGFKTSLELLFRDSTSLHSFSISASLGDLCALAVNSFSSPTTTDTYDANGNTTSSLITDHGSLGTNASDIYSFDNRLIRRTTPDGKTIDLTYNPDGHRLTKFITQNGLTQRLIHYLTDANNPTGYAQVIEEKDPLEASNKQLTKVHLYGYDLISSLITDHSALITKPIYYSYDGLGSVRSITTPNGDLQETYDYDAYGTLIGLAKRNPTTGLLESSNLSSTIPDPQSEFLYTGEQWDADLGMYFLRARYLNTNTGRFHTQDTYEGRNGEPLTLHKYLYANGNPAMFTDPSGKMSLGEMSATIQGQLAIGAILNAGLGFASGERTVGQIGSNLVEGAMLSAAFHGVGSVAGKAFIQLGKYIPFTKVGPNILQVLQKLSPAANGVAIPGTSFLSQMTLKTSIGEFVISSGSTTSGAVTGALKHLVDELLKKSGAAGGTKIAEALAIQELEAAIILAAQQGIKQDVNIVVKTAAYEWDLIFDLSRGVPRLYHALSKSL